MSIKQTLQAILEALQNADNNRLWTYDDLKRFFKGSDPRSEAESG